MAFIHNKNNIFLSKFNKYINIINVHKNKILKYLCIECKMVSRFLNFYNNKDIVHCALHAYFTKIFYDIYCYHKELQMIYDDEEMIEDDEWNFATFIESKESTKEWMEQIEQEIEENEPDQDL